MLSDDSKVTWHVSFGQADASGLLVNAKTTNAVNQLAHAQLSLGLENADVEPLDLFSEVKIQAELEGGTLHDMFTGSVISASVSDGLAELALQSGPSLEELKPSPRWTHLVSAAENIYTIVREAGFPDEKMVIEGLSDIPVEQMLVTVPIEGLVLTGPISIGEITFVPYGEAVAPYASRGVPHLVYDPLVATSVHAVFTTSAALLRAAEVQGLHAVDVVLGMLQLGTRYGLLFAPDGTTKNFDRERSRAQLRRGEVVAVEGLVSGRCWVRVPDDRTPALDLTLEQADVLVLGHEPSLAEQQALIAWQRAASEHDPIAQATALSDALEFYAAGISAPDMFDSDEVASLLASLPKLEPHKLKVARDAIKRLNAAPLKQRIRTAASRDGAPLTEAELSFLWKRIRTACNKAVHGQAADVPTLYELERALSLVGRLIAFRLARTDRFEEVPTA